VKQNLIVLNLNAQGLKNSNKYTLFCEFLNSSAPDIVFISEHWLDNNEVGSFFVTGYKLISSFGRKTKERGGTLILAKIALNHEFKKLKLKSIELVSAICHVKYASHVRSLVKSPQ
jgi:exonuclease III